VNPWVEKSIRLAESEGYLDKLAEIYPAQLPPRRPLNQWQREEIKRLHEARDWHSLLKFLFKLIDEGHPFPFEHPYASIFYQHPNLISKNPRTAALLGKILLSKEPGEIISGVERPPDLNRMYGPSFRRWLKKVLPQRGYKLLKEKAFRIHKGPALLDGADKTIRRYVKTVLGFDPGGRDFLIKIGDVHIVGEARFLTRGGGSQNRDIREALSFVKKFKSKRKFIPVAVLDGVVWFDKSYIEQLKELEEDEPAFTALLLEDFLESLK